MVKFKVSESCIENSMDNALQFISQYQCCPLCPPSLLIKQSFQKHFISTHFHRAVDINVSGKAVSCLPCYKNCTNTNKRSHFHCCMCPAVITRRFNFKRHLELCSTAGKRLFSGDDKVPDDATSTKLLKSMSVVDNHFICYRYNTINVPYRICSMYTVQGSIRFILTNYCRVHL
ncbi:unnamed protein product [Clavelina lepadiformis]|uniref:Uncharacterized protein n=1 Tax=Clavelina lepadiformis TaxID=159417 RepID=A0ABP0GHM5_CLALP